MARDESLLDQARRVDAAVAVLRRHAAARERQRKPVPTELREPIAQSGSELGSVRKQLNGDRHRPKTIRA